MKREKITDHHRVPESFGGTRLPENILRIKEKKHAAFHMVFDNRTPVSQFEYLLNFNGIALCHDFRSAVMKALSSYKGENELYAYKNGVLVPQKFIEAQQKYSSK